MEIRVLKYFLTVVNEESITRASEILHITQPTLSRQLKDLEEELGVTLFHRGSRKITLTSEGLILKRRAEEILDLVDLTVTEIQEQNQELEGTITIGSGEFSSVRILADLCADFQKKYPRVKFDLFTATADVVKEKLNHGLADIGLCLEPIDKENFAFIRLPVKEKWVVVCKTDDELSRKEEITVADLLDRSLILPRRRNVQSEVAHWFGDDFAKLKVTYTGDLMTNLAMMVQKGVGVALSVEGANALWNPDLLVTRPLRPTMENAVDLCWRKNSCSYVTERFIEYTKCFLGHELAGSNEKET